VRRGGGEVDFFILFRFVREGGWVMLISIAMMFLVGMSMGWICKKIHLPSLFGMIVTGIVLGPYVLDVIDASILNISSDLRRIALIIILMRAGLSLDLNDLKKVGRPAVLMCFVPACFEIGGMVLLAPKLLGISILDAAIMGTVIAAVSPAVIVPKMLKLMEEGYGVKKSIPQMIAGTIVVENVFSWPGLGTLCISSIFNRDLPVIQTYVLFIGVLFVVFNLVFDILQTVSDPRLRKES